MIAAARAAFPGAADYDRIDHRWAGLRPMTPDGTPIVGPTPYDNLTLATGHGTLGWTHGCGSGRALADLISGRRPEVDFAFCGVEAGPAPAVRGGLGVAAAH